MEPVRKHSRKRDAILSCVRATTCHPTAEWVYNQLKPEIPDLSLGTVYRNLTMFKNDGVIESLGTFQGLERFDGWTVPHTHLFCTQCGAVMDAGIVALPDEIYESVKQETGGEVETMRLRFYGRCPDCVKSEE